MAHVGELLLQIPEGTAGNHKTKSSSSQKLCESEHESLSDHNITKSKHVWRLQKQPDVRKYQLFPPGSTIVMPVGRRSPDPEQAFALAMAQAASDRSCIDEPRLKTRETSLPRRQNISISEHPGPMTTVQELCMDSPTIPGRPPLHERSISAPGTESWRQNDFGLSSSSIDPEVIVDEQRVESASYRQVQPSDRQAQVSGRQAHLSNTTHQQIPLPKVPMSPKDLPRLRIPFIPSLPIHCASKKSPLIPGGKRSVAVQECRLADTPPEVPPKSARLFVDRSPPVPSRLPPTKPSSDPFGDFPLLRKLSASVGNLASSTTPSTTSLPLPATPESTSYEKHAPITNTIPTLLRGTNQSPSGSSPAEEPRSSSSMSHTREYRDHQGRSEPENSIMNRGRPPKRLDSSSTKSGRVVRTNFVDQASFDALPIGVKARDVSTKYEAHDIDALRRQALGQAAKFEVLSTRDVDGLSRELRALDERTAYLRKTLDSLRSGRRNLHERICSYLRSPRLAVFSTNALLKQEETLVELDLSIEDWVTKLDLAENRRMRVRQKLLEHVAAALTMPTSGADARMSTRSDSTIVMRHLSGQDTPPRSPSPAKSVSPSSSPSPQRLARIVEPVTLPAPLQHRLSVQSKFSVRRPSGESVRIFLDSDVYALLADVEEELNLMADHEEIERKDRGMAAVTDAFLLKPVTFRQA